MANKPTVTVQTTVNAPLEKVWASFTKPEHITKWNFASPDWHCPRATNDLRPGGTFNWRMEARDGSQGFDFGGTYDEVVPMQVISYTIGDGRKVRVNFNTIEGEPDRVLVVENFETESQNPIEMQRAGWQAILDNFKVHTETIK